MGADVISREDSLMIKGRKYLYNTNIKTFSDHRIAMAFIVLSIAAFGKYEIDNKECINISLPGFFNTIEVMQS